MGGECAHMEGILAGRFVDGMKGESFMLTVQS